MIIKYFADSIRVVTVRIFKRQVQKINFYDPPYLNFDVFWRAAYRGKCQLRNRSATNLTNSIGDFLKIILFDIFFEYVPKNIPHHLEKLEMLMSQKNDLALSV
mgnify:CR=1 FL=1